jgi:coenzyme Q-binding protein COQ10
MMKSGKAATVLSVVLFLACFGSSARAEVQDEEKLSRGEILFTMEVPDKDKPPVFQVRGVVDCSRDQVWKLINDYDHLQSILPGIVEGRVEKVEGNVVYFYEKDHVPVVEDTWYRLRCVHDDANFRKTLSMVEGSVKSLEASWVLEPFGEGKTLAVYTLQTDPGFYIPRWVQKMSLGRTTRGFIEAIRAKACSADTH